jgi:hypothetical protein
VAEVWVNGTKAAIILTRQTPDITAHLHKGSNEIAVRVIGSLKNLYGPHYVNSRGIMSPWMWNGVETERPGADYDLLDYGMQQDFKLIY